VVQVADRVRLGFQFEQWIAADSNLSKRAIGQVDASKDAKGDEGRERRYSEVTFSIHRLGLASRLLTSKVVAGTNELY